MQCERNGYIQIKIYANKKPCRTRNPLWATWLYPNRAQRVSYKQQATRSPQGISRSTYMLYSKHTFLTIPEPTGDFAFDLHVVFKAHI